MPIITCWDDPQQTIYHMLLRHGWKAEELLQAAKYSHREIQRVKHLVYTLVEIEGKFKPPPGLLRVLADLPFDIPPNRLFIVVVSTDAIVKTIMNIMRTIAPSYFRAMHQVNTLDEAYLLIEQDRQGTRHQDIS